MIDHALQPVARVDHVRDRLDVPQLDETVAAELEVRRVTPFARHTFTRDFVRIVDGHDVFSLSDVRLMGPTGLIGLMERQSLRLPVSPSLRPSVSPSLCPWSRPKHSVSNRRASPV